MTDDPRPASRTLELFFGGLLILAGGAMALLSGACMLVFGAMPEGLGIALAFGGLPFLLGLAAAWAGVRIITQSRPPPAPVRPPASFRDDEPG